MTPTATSLSLSASSSAYDVGGALTPALANSDLLYQAPIPREMNGTPDFTPSNVIPPIAAVLILESQPYLE